MDQVVGIIWDVVKCLCGCANKEVAYVNDLEENLKSLKDKWAELQRKRRDLHIRVDEAENTREMQRTQEVGGWMEQVDALQKGIEDTQVQGDREIQNKCLCKFCPKNCVSSYKLGKNIVKMSKNVNELITKGEQFLSKDVEISHKLPPRPVEMPLNEIVGLEWMVDQVWNSIEAENVGVIGLYGMGGVGKTTLLKRINNELGKKRPDFDVVMWVVVSKDFDVHGIMDNIRKKLRIENDIWKDCNNRDEKAGKIYQVLKNKKFVLLLDDIWERMDLRMVGVPHPKDTDFQSKVLFTTRLEDVCAKMHAQRKFKVEILTDKEALELFYTKVGVETLRSHPNIPNLAKEMATECKGLPLALTVVGSSMAGVKSVEAWEYSAKHLRSSSWTAQDFETKVLSILKFSYERLPDETHKSCFMYCALFPEDFEIRVLDLIDKWIAEGFLAKEATNRIQDMYRYGESVIEKLKRSSLVESVEDDLWLERTVKLHDVIRDLALWLACDQDRNKKRILVEGDALAVSQNDVETWKIVERISIWKQGELHFPTITCPNLITLTMTRGINIDVMCTISTNIQYMRKLKVLDLEFRAGESFNAIKLPPEIGGLILLEYLSLGEILELPIELKNLRNLKFFSLKVNNKEEFINLFVQLSEVISSFEHLRVLSLLYAIYLDEILESDKERGFLEKLECLPNLQEIRAPIFTEKGLEKLLGSTKLQSCIRGLGLGPMVANIKMPLLLAAMSKMKQIQWISFIRLRNLKDCSIFETCCLSMVRFVDIHFSNSITHLTWLRHAPLLQKLDIMMCSSLDEVIKDEKGREQVDDHNIFSSLVELHLRCLPVLKSICEVTLSFPSLRSMTISRCPNLKMLPFDTSSAMDKLRHIEGDQQWWDNLEWEDKHKFQSKFKSI